MPLAPYSSGPEESVSSRVLTFAIGTMLTGGFFLIFFLRPPRDVVVIFGPAIGLCMFAATAVCVRWLCRAKKEEKRMRRAAWLCTALLAISAIAAFGTFILGHLGPVG